MARILVADDDAEVVSLIREFLQGLGHEVRCEPDGLAAGIRARQWLPDLIISDIQMPHFLGTTAVVGLQQSAATAAIPVIFISAIAPATAEKMLEIIRGKLARPELARFIPKPIDFQLLGRCLVELLPHA